MSKLTSEDIRTVETFFASPLGIRFADSLAAQTYEPRGAGYQPSTDTRLAALVLRGVRPGKSAWTLASCVIDQLCGRPGGSAHLDVLYRAIGSRASVGKHTPRAIAYGRELAKDAARMAILESEYRTCEYRGLSTYETTARVLALDSKFYGRPIEVSHGAVLAHAYEAVVAGLINVETEIDALIDAAADALHAARDRVRAAEDAAAERKQNRAASLRAELAGKSPREHTATTRNAKRAAQLLVDCLELARAS